MYSWFHQSNFSSFTPGITGSGAQGVTGAQGATGASAVIPPQTVMIPAQATRVIDVWDVGAHKAVSYSMFFDNGSNRASSKMDLLDTPDGLTHNIYAELGKGKMYEVSTGTTGGSSLILVENKTIIDMEVSYTKTII
jgi:hypothetical protein